MLPRCAPVVALFIPALALGCGGGTNAHPTKESTVASAQVAIPPVTATAEVPAPSVLDGWTTFAPSGAGFTINVPSQPEIEDLGVGSDAIFTGRAQLAKVQTESIVMAIQWGDTTKDVTNDLGVRVKLGQSFTDRFDGADVKIGDVRISEDIEATEIHVKSVDGTRGASARVFAYGKKVALVIVTYVADERPKVDAAFASIKLSR